MRADSSRRITPATVVIELSTPSPSDLEAMPPTLRLLEEAIRTSYAALAGQPLEFQTIVVEQDLLERRMSVWLRVSSDADPEGSSTGTREEAFLRFLGRGTLTILGWLNASEPRLTDLQLALRVLACGEVLKSSAQPAAPKSAPLVRAITAWQDAKNALSKGDRVRIAFEKGIAELDLSKTISDPASLLRTALVSNRAAELIFIVELPDYTGIGSWELRHGESRIRATLSASPILNAFHRRERDIRPGDAVRCRVDFETFYGEDFEVVSEQLRVVDVLEVLQATPFAPPCAPETEESSSGDTESEEDSNHVEPARENSPTEYAAF